MAADKDDPKGILLTPREVADRLRVADVDEERWVRRACQQHGVPVTRVRGRVRLTEEQFRHLLESMTCSPSVESMVSSDAKSAERARMRIEAEPPSPPEKHDPDPEEELIERERETKLRQAVLNLFGNDPEMQTLVEGIMEDLSGDELCELCGVDRKTLATRRRAFRRGVDRAYPQGWRYDD